MASLDELQGARTSSRTHHTVFPFTKKKKQCESQLQLLQQANNEAEKGSQPPTVGKMSMVCCYIQFHSLATIFLVIT